MPGSTAKCMVRHKNARFDTKMPGSTQKCPPQHESVDIAIIKHPPTPCEKYFFPILFKYFVFKNSYRNENEIILIWIQIYSISWWNLKCNYSFLFGMTIMSTAINKCYRCSRIILPISAFLLIAPLKSDTHVVHCRFNNALNKNFHNYSQ